MRHYKNPNLDVSRFTANERAAYDIGVKAGKSFANIAFFNAVDEIKKDKPRFSHYEQWLKRYFWRWLEMNKSI